MASNMEQPGASALAPPAVDVVLNRVEADLRRKDAIMEPGVMDKLRQYVKAGGQPSTAIEMLSENYKGALEHGDVYCLRN